MAKRVVISNPLGRVVNPIYHHLGPVFSMLRPVFTAAGTAVEATSRGMGKSQLGFDGKRFVIRKGHGREKPSFIFINGAGTTKKMATWMARQLKGIIEKDKKMSDKIGDLVLIYNATHVPDHINPVAGMGAIQAYFGEDATAASEVFNGGESKASKQLSKEILHHLEKGGNQLLCLAGHSKGALDMARGISSALREREHQMQDKGKSPGAIRRQIIKDVRRLVVLNISGIISSEAVFPRELIEYGRYQEVYKLGDPAMWLADHSANPKVWPRAVLDVKVPLWNFIGTTSHMAAFFKDRKMGQEIRRFISSQLQ